MRILNVMEQITMNLFQEFELHYKLKCNCDLCRTDILALALNNIPPKYVSSEKGEVLMRAIHSDVQSKQDIIRELTSAAMKVESNPRH